jgi:hypothetical protein
VKVSGGWGVCIMEGCEGRVKAAVCPVTQTAATTERTVVQ